MEIAAPPPATGLLNIVEALRRQLDETKKGLLHLQHVKTKKETLITTGQRILNHHCAATFPPLQFSDEAQASIFSLEACPTGWKVVIHLHGSLETLRNAHITLAVIHPSITCRSKKIIITDGRPHANSSSSSSSTPKMNLRITSFLDFDARDGSGDGDGGDGSRYGDVGQVYALVMSAEGEPLAAVPAGEIKIDRCAWIQALVHPETPPHDGGMEVRDICTNKRWASVEYYTVQIPPESGEMMEEWWLLIFEQTLGCSFSLIDEEDGSTCIWSLGSAAEIRLCTSSGSSSPIDTHEAVKNENSQCVSLAIHASTMQLVVGLQQEIQSQLSRVAAAKKVPTPLMTPAVKINSNDNDSSGGADGYLVSALDSLLAELEAISTWIVALKQQQSETGGGGGGARRDVVAAQTAAVHAMMRTNREATVAL